MVQQITSGAEFRRLIACGKLVVVDFTASWCGPCRMVAPQYEALSGKYPNVLFTKVVQDNNPEICETEAIRAFPTFRFYHNGQLLEEVTGANIAAVETAVQTHNVAAAPQTFTGSGFSLGAASGEDPREALRRRYGGPSITEAPPAPPIADGQPPAAPGTSGRTMAQLDQEDAEDEALLAEALKSSMSKATEDGAGGAVTMIEPPVDAEPLAQLLEFGFPELRAKKALLASGMSVEAAISWLEAHQEDMDIDEPIALVPQLDLSALPGAPPPKKKLTAEELKARIAARRLERAEVEKVDEVAREKNRREMGKNMNKTAEELQRLQRKREAEAAKREKEAFAAERERLRAEIAKDKAERAARQGYLPGRLDAEGYAPSGLQAPYGAAMPGSGAKPSGKASPTGESNSGKELSPLEQVDKAVGIIAKQKIGDAGSTCLKTLIAYIKNIADNPAEEKFRNINVENKAFKARVAPVVGALSVLKAVGFTKVDDGAEPKWSLTADNINTGLLNEVRGKLEQALEKA